MDKCGAERGTRTPKGLLPLAPQASASASSATSAHSCEPRCYCGVSESEAWPPSESVSGAAAGSVLRCRRRSSEVQGLRVFRRFRRRRSLGRTGLLDHALASAQLSALLDAEPDRRHHEQHRRRGRRLSQYCCSAARAERPSASPCRRKPRQGQPLYRFAAAPRRSRTGRSPRAERSRRYIIARSML